ncbi:titin-like [Haliotis asinina]|uniref:titin-like n=1 Tax=Haliotis asinina TaxID=109174 RepID=UPI003531E0C7
MATGGKDDWEGCNQKEKETSGNRDIPSPIRSILSLNSWIPSSYGLGAIGPRGDMLHLSSSSSGFNKRLKNLEVIRGAAAIFTCELHDDTEETGQWFFNDVALTHSNKTQTTVNERERQLTVADVQFGDTGKYEYRVGQDKTSAHLSLNEAICVDSILNPPQPALRRA